MLQSSVYQLLQMDIFGSLMPVLTPQSTSGHGKGKDKIITPMIGINFLSNLFLSFYNRPFCGSLDTRSSRKENKNEAKT